MTDAAQTEPSQTEPTPASASPLLAPVTASLTPAQWAHLKDRRQQIRYWPFVALVLFTVLAAAYAYLWRTVPFYVNPAIFMERLQAGRLDTNTLEKLAGLGSLAGLGAGLFIASLLALATLALRNESRLITMIDALLPVQNAEPAVPFHDHFSSVAADYASYRPHYPDALFAALAQAAPSTARAWDCGTGNGQAVAGLAAHFQAVWATDASAAQITQALNASTPWPEQVQFAVAEAGASGLPEASVDVVLAAQAAHWFDLPAFYAEAARVLRPNGVLALVTYSGVKTGQADIDALLHEFHQTTMGPFWPPQRAYVDNHYRDLPFPWPDMAFPAQTMVAAWSLDQLMGYLGTWSATAAYRAQRGTDPLPALREQLLPLWGSAEQVRELSWELPLRIARKP